MRLFILAALALSALSALPAQAALRLERDDARRELRAIVSDEPGENQVAELVRKISGGAASFEESSLGRDIRISCAAARCELRFSGSIEVNYDAAAGRLVINAGEDPLRDNTFYLRRHLLEQGGSAQLFLRSHAAELLSLYIDGREFRVNVEWP